MNLIAAAIIGIAIIVLLIAVCKVHPFLSLLAGSFTMAVCAGVEYDEAFGSFTSGVGSTIANVGNSRYTDDARPPAPTGFRANPYPHTSKNDIRYMWQIPPLWKNDIRYMWQTY